MNGVKLGFSVFIKTTPVESCCHGNSAKGVILFCFVMHIYGGKFKNTALIFLEILFYSAFYNF